MEHRYSVRSHQIIDVCLRHPAIGTAYARSVNIGLGGMLLDIKHPCLPVNALVNLSFHLGARRKKNQHHIQAMVVHHGPNGTGFMFDDRDDNLHKALVDFLTAHHDQPAALAGPPPRRPLQSSYR